MRPRTLTRSRSPALPGEGFSRNGGRQRPGSRRRSPGRPRSAIRASRCNGPDQCRSPPRSSHARRWSGRPGIRSRRTAPSQGRRVFDVGVRSVSPSLIGLTLPACIRQLQRTWFGNGGLAWRSWPRSRRGAAALPPRWTRPRRLSPVSDKQTRRGPVATAGAQTAVGAQAPLPPRPRIARDPISSFGAKRRAKMVAYVRRYYVASASVKAVAASAGDVARKRRRRVPTR